MAMNSIASARPRRPKSLRTSAKLRATPVPRLNRPLTDGCRAATDYVDTVTHIDEITQLAAIGVVGMVRSEERHRPSGTSRARTSARRRSHRTLVILVGAETLKNLSPTHCGGVFVARATRRATSPVENVLAPAVGVQRLESLQARPVIRRHRTRIAVAIGRRRRGVDRTGPDDPCTTATTSRSGSR